MSHNGGPLQETGSSSSNIPAAAEDDHEPAETGSVGKALQKDKKNRPVFTALEPLTPEQAATKATVELRDDWFDNPAYVDGRYSSAGTESKIKWDMSRESYRFDPCTLPTTPGKVSTDHLANIEIGLGDTVELKNGAFVQIDNIHESRRQDPETFSGHLFERNRRLKGWLPIKAEDEVFWLWTFRGDHTELAAPARIMALTSEVIRKWNLHKRCPRAFHNNSPRDQKSSCEQAGDTIRRRDDLSCRWKYVRLWKDSIDRDEYESHVADEASEERALITLAAMEGDEDSNRSGRGSPSTPVSRGDGSHGKKPGVERLNDSQDTLSKPPITTSGPSLAGKSLPRYTFGDAFCGCGGMSRGAVMAGLDVQWGFDIDPVAMASYQTNFPTAIGVKCWAHQFESHGTDADFKVDILHFSTPCQFFSIAHQRPGKDDVMNSSSLFTIPRILHKIDPRVVTAEQVPNIAVEHAQYFTSLIQFFTWAGYSIRWKVINCADFGVPQRRERLILIGSRPGTNLPHFPSTTHTGGEPSHRLLPWTTVSNAFNQIPSECTENTRPALHRQIWKPYDAHQPHEHAVLAHDNGVIYHPNGNDPVTIRELACLQSFPYDFLFEGTRSQKWSQIGNAVPPPVGHAILEEVKRSLMDER